MKSVSYAVVAVVSLAVTGNAASDRIMIYKKHDGR